MKRYEITKNFYKHYIIYILVKGKYRLYNVDKEISNNFKLDNMVIISIVCEISVYCSLFVRIFNKNRKLSVSMVLWGCGIVELRQRCGSGV